MKAQLILENGMVFEGRAFGHLKESIGDVVFNTSMMGYQELLTDPTCYGQMVVMTYPLIGNYGINLDDMESDKIHVKALIVREKCDFPNNFRCELTLDGYLKANRIIGLEGIDTRALTKVIRDHGVMKGIIAVRELTPSQIKLKLDAFSNSDAVMQVTTPETYTIDGNGKHIGIIDLGIKQNIIQSLKLKGCKLTIFPATTKADEILAENVDGVLISNGPASPNDIPSVIEQVKKLEGKTPIVGVGLGHQVLALALGGTVGKLPFGHNGGQPVKDIKNNKVMITSQSHNYVVKELPKEAVASHVNVNDETIEGMYIQQKRIYSVQFHPQPPAISGDVDPILNQFLTIIEGGTL